MAELGIYTRKDSNPAGTVVAKYESGADDYYTGRASGAQPKRMTPQRQRVLDIAREGPALRPAELAELAGVGTSVVKALVADGALETVALPALAPFAVPDPGVGGHLLSPEQEKS